MSRGETLTFLTLLSIALFLTARYALWWFRYDNVPTNYRGDATWAIALANVGPFVALTWLEALRVLQMSALWIFGLFMQNAIPMAVPAGYRVAVLTTIVPSKEPVSVLEQTLQAMTRIRHREGFDIWVLDEEDSPEVRSLCWSLGVHHFTRHGIEKYNQPSGRFRARTKAGNHNAWRDQHGAEYDIVAQMDPDHVPSEDFLEKTLGYFRDPNVAYVIAPQVYYRNTDSSWIARGADEQNFGFSAITQRGANFLGMPIFIGSNHLCRTVALDSVGGYASHIVEDHLTGMMLLTTTNPETGDRWKGVYTEEIITYGEGPSRWSSYLSQQLRWAYGLVNIVQHHSFRLLLRMRPEQAFGFTLIQSYYGSVAIILLTGLSLTTAHLVFGLNALSVPFGEWLSYWVPQLSISIAIWYWLQRFYLRESDRGWGLRAILAGIGAMVVYTQAFVTSLFGRGLAYVITPKGEVGTREPLRLFRWHLASLAVSLGALGWSIWHSEGAPTIRFWAVLNSIQMVIVIGTGVVAPGVLRTRISWKWFDSMSRYAVRVAVPITAGVGGLLVAAVISSGPSSSGQTPPVAPADMTPVTQEPTTAAPTPTPTSTPTPAPVGLVSASFLEPGSSAVAFGEFTLGGAFDVSAKVHHEFVDFAPGSVERLRQAVDRAATANQVAMLSWEPKFAGRPLESTGLIAQIDAGAFDDYLAGAAAALRDTKQPILLRFAPEMDHVSDELHPWSGEQPELFISAWRRIHAIFQEQGASNVLFAWTPGGYLVDGVFASDAWYPGDDVVDLVGFTAYAFWVWEEWDEERAATHAYRSPEELILPRYEALLEHGKPVIIPELGISLHPTQQAEQAAWLVALIDFIDRDLPELAAIVYFHAPHTFVDVDIDWRLTPEEQRVLAERLAASDRIELSVPAR
jgi:cellulose synthase/poly-beta-1,6-N-acetylglucosamine synthase-like glycosyltransferase